MFKNVDQTKSMSGVITIVTGSGIPERVVHALVEVVVDGQPGNDVGEGHYHEGQEQQHDGVDEGVEGEGEQDHQTHPKHHRTQLQVVPVDDIQDWRQEHENKFNNKVSELVGHYRARLLAINLKVSSSQQSKKLATGHSISPKQPTKNIEQKT